MEKEKSLAPLYREAYEHDACGIGAVINIEGRKNHKTIDDALKIVEKLEHRAGKDAKGQTGDGVGIMLQISHNFFISACNKLNIELGNEREYGVGMFFLPNEGNKADRVKRLFEILAKKEGLSVLGWREVPTCPELLGEKARNCMPYICQCFVKKPENIECGVDFDRVLYIVRRELEQSGGDSYVVSLSSRTIVYKGMFLVNELRRFYLDLEDEKNESAFALVHSRFSTNTNPSWERAHPNRIILHNGEINTIRGNIDRMLAREETMYSSKLSDHIEKVLPVVNTNGSDSAMLDNTLEFLMYSGMELPKAVMLTIPEPWNNNKEMSKEKRDMYNYYATMMEPWDGPAAVLFSDGDIVGATLDRNGLRPARYYETKDGYIILASEVGVLEIPDENIVKKDRLHPGKMLLVDTLEGRVITDEEIKNKYAMSNPYGKWLSDNIVLLKDLEVPNKPITHYEQDYRDRLYKAFGYGYEEVFDIIKPMAENGVEPTFAMGNDIPLSVLSKRNKNVFDYFKQLFAQVTNPPIDAIREEVVTDTTVYVGSDGNLLEDVPENCRVLQIRNPILTDSDINKIKALNEKGLKTRTISLLYYKNTSLERAVERVFMKADKAYFDGCNILVLSDRGVDENHVAIPSLLAVSALEKYLVRTKKRTGVSVVLESGEPRNVHHFATLLGYGAMAIYPYLAHECIFELIDKGILNKDKTEAIEAYNDSVLHGVLKIASKMGVSTIQSYQSAQLFEAIGLNKTIIDKYFTNTISRIGGIGIEDINNSIHYNHDKAFDPMGFNIDTTLDSTGFHKVRSGKNTEAHLYNPKTIATLQRAVREGSYELFKEFTGLIDNSENPYSIRSLFEFNIKEENKVPIDEVEDEREIVTRFQTGAMSYGSLSKEAHECLAEAMNSIGGRSNTGEGGEDVLRLNTDKSSAVKQVASARFGVTSQYLVSAKEIQIKMAQGAKPGEGGHLPGNKVYPWVAKTRHSTPGVSLISPPPHHDIYSIEDLAQLIYDLKNANKRADISVKLVSEPGVGTIAAGVAKAGAHTILVAGYDGGTGAAPVTSIHDAGLPWELGLSEAHQTLIKNGLRSRVRLETDGKLLTGRDVAIAAILGAEFFGFATAPLVCLGCVMMRICNKDTCPVGIATQNPKLRDRFKGKSQYVVNFMMYIARELREIMADLGVRSVDELIGRYDLLKINNKDFDSDKLDLSPIINNGRPLSVRYRERDKYDFKLSETLDEKVLLKNLLGKLENKEKGSLTVNITSTDRSFGTIFGSEITRLYGNTLEDDTYCIKCIGGGGQSFGAFIPKGLTLSLEGDSNDYFGKGLSGGRLIVYPPKSHSYKEDSSIIIGNVALYGATGGSAFINGVAGERFCVRNSGACAVCEGVGDHGLEYMTGGVAVIIGEIGKNFAAGMSGGVAYVLDENNKLSESINSPMVNVYEATEDEDIKILKGLLEEHKNLTSSKKAGEILSDFNSFIHKFKKVIPDEYEKMQNSINKYIKDGYSKDEAELKAFYDKIEDRR